MRRFSRLRKVSNPDGCGCHNRLDESVDGRIVADVGMARRVSARCGNRSCRFVHSPSAAGNAGEIRQRGCVRDDASGIVARCVSRSSRTRVDDDIDLHARLYEHVRAGESESHAELAFGAILINGLAFAVAAPLAGMLCDRFGRKPVMLCAVGALVVLVIPCFRILVEMRSAASLYIVTGVLSIGVQTAAVAVLTAVTETLPSSVRSIGLGTIYALAIAIFGGSAQFVVSLLVEATGSSLAPGFYMTGALVVGGLAMLAFPTTPRPKR